MAAIGNSPTQQAFTPAIDYFSGNGSTTAFTLSRPVASVAQVQVTIDNVAQNPSSAYTVSANTITFTSAPLSGTNNIYVYYTSPITQVIAPGQGTVTTASLASSTGSGAVVLATSPTLVTPVLGAASATSITVAAGAVGTPSITTAGDTNTGIFFPAADTIAFSEGGSESMRIDSSGSVAIGSTSTASATRLTLKGAGTGGNTLFNCQDSGGTALLTITESGVVNLPNAVSGDAHLKIQVGAVTTLGAIASSGIQISGGGSNNQLCQISLGYPGTYAPTAISSITTTQSGNTIADLIFATRGVNTDTAPSEKMRIVSDGNIRLGMQNYSSQPSASNYGVSLNNTNAGCNFFAGANGVQTHLIFGNLNGVVGSVQTNGSSTAFNTSSDYRLKEDVQPMTGALAKVARLKPVTYKWKADGSDGEGFIAHELKEVCPHAVNGEKDELDENGDIKPQGMDVSFLVATLTAAIQELSAKNDALTARIEALENR